MCRLLALSMCLIRAPVLLGLPACLALAPVLLGLGLCLAGGSDLFSGGPPPVEEQLLDVVDTGAALPEGDEMVTLARKDPVAFLEKVLIRYERDMKSHEGYLCLLVKRERLNGKMPPPEKTEEMAVRFREEPHSVLLDWKKNPGKAQRVLYVKGENDGNLVVQPRGVGAFRLWERDPLGAEAMESGRYPLTEFGIQIGSRRTLTSWKSDPKLTVEYLGEQKMEQLGGRTCYVLRRSGYRSAHPGDRGVVEIESTFYFDKETWLQIGSVLKAEDGELLAEYWFRDLKWVEKFDADAFTRKAVKEG